MASMILQPLTSSYASTSISPPSIQKLYWLLIRRWSSRSFSTLPSFGVPSTFRRSYLIVGRKSPVKLIITGSILAVPCSAGSINNHVTVLQLLYSIEIPSTIDSASTALELLSIALELLFENCVSVTAYVRYLETLPWIEEEERTVLSSIPLLRDDESSELLARVSPRKSDLMLHGMISAIHNRPNVAFVAKLSRDC